MTGGEIGIEIDGAENVKIEHVRVSGTSLDAIQARRASVTIRDCLIHSPVGDYAQGIDISFGFDLPPSLIEGCTIVGGREGINLWFAVRPRCWYNRSSVPQVRQPTRQCTGSPHA